jgi:hypothetical protein
MEVGFFLCAESAVVDSTSNKLTILNIIEEMSAVGFPAVMPVLTIVALFSKNKAENTKPRMNVVCAQNKKQIFSIPIEPDFQGKLRTRIIVGIQGVVLPGFGRMTVSLNHKSKTIATWPIEIVDVRSLPMAIRPQPAVASGTNLPMQTNVRRRRRR